MSSTMKVLCKNALDVQDACNLSGVVHSFSRVMTELRALNPHMSTDELNRHPVAVMWSSKIASLTGSEDAGTFNRADDFCRANARLR